MELPGADLLPHGRYGRTPHILTRYYTTPSVRQARTSVGWSLFFIFLLYFTAPSYAAFARFEAFTKLVGAKISALPDG